MNRISSCWLGIGVALLMTFNGARKQSAESVAYHYRAGLESLVSDDDKTQMLIAALDAGASAEQSLLSQPVRAKPESRTGEHAIRIIIGERIK